MAGQKPRSGWIYMINPKQVVLQCSQGHTNIYDISGLEEFDCFHPLCTLKINSSRVMRGEHPYIVWSSYMYGKFQLYHAIPLTSKDTFRGLPTCYPIKPNSINGLNHESLALVHQLTPVDIGCFKTPNGDWIERIGVINTTEKRGIEERLTFALNLPNNPSDNWFKENSTPDLLEKVFMLIDPTQREEAVSRLIDQIDSPFQSNT